MTPPRYIALCGAPGAGKSTVARILHERYGLIEIDDGFPLRAACAALFGAPLRDFATQDGKAEQRQVGSCRVTNRKILGDLGNDLEARYGTQLLAQLAIERAEAQYGRHATGFVFPSCRKNQGICYREAGGLVLEVARPGYLPVHDFDHYDRTLLTHVIYNSGDLEFLASQVSAVFDQVFGGF